MDDGWTKGFGETEQQKAQRFGFGGVLANPCPNCGAQAFEPCMPVSLRVPHQRRVDQVVVPPVVDRHGTEAPA